MVGKRVEGKWCKLAIEQGFVLSLCNLLPTAWSSGMVDKRQCSTVVFFTASNRDGKTNR